MSDDRTEVDNRTEAEKAQDEANFRKRMLWDFGELCEFMRPDPVTGEMKPIPKVE